MSIALKLTADAKWLRRGMNIWPPFVGAGISVTRLDQDFLSAQVRMKLRWYNRNYVGTQYGGNLYSMTDAFYAIMIMRNIGRQYYVWDQSASINYIAPAKGEVYADFNLSQVMLDVIKSNTDAGQKYLFKVTVLIKNEAGQLVSKVMKTLYIRKKPEFR